MSQQEDGHLLHLGPASLSVSCRCFFNKLESNVFVCIPSDLPNSQGFAAHETLPLPDDSNCSTVAKEMLVSGYSETMHCQSKQVASETLLTETTQYNNIPSGSQSLQSECMVAIDRQFATKGFWQRNRNLLSASWRTGTQRDYSGKFKQFNSWCRGKQIDTYSASLTDCAEFLTILFDKG